MQSPWYALLLILAQFLILALRWMWLINIGRKHIEYRDSLQITLASLLANFLFITSISGIVVRIGLVMQYGVSALKSISATIIDRLMTLTALVVLAALFLPALGQYLENDLYKSLCLYLGVLAFVMFVFTPFFLQFVLKHLPKTRRNKNVFSGAIRYTQLFLNNPKLQLKVITSSFFAQVCFFAATYIIGVSLGVERSFLELMTVLPAIALISSLPLSIGGWGIREGAFVFGYSLLGISMETAFTISVQIGLISMIATVIAGSASVIIRSNNAANTKKHNPFSFLSNKKMKLPS